MPRPALFPVHDEKPSFKGQVVVPEERRLARAWPAVQKDQSGIFLSHAAKPKVLGDTADGHGFHGRDASRNDATVSISESFRVDATDAADECG
jgi:hypothetical protein